MDKQGNSHSEMSSADSHGESSLIFHSLSLHFAWTTNIFMIIFVLNIKKSFICVLPLNVEGTKSSSRKGVHIADTSALHCKNDCGFYGNREWDGYCSICYKQIRQQHTNSLDSTDAALTIGTSNNINHNTNANSNKSIRKSSLVEGGYGAVNSDLTIISPPYATHNDRKNILQSNKHRQVSPTVSGTVSTGSHSGHHSTSSLSMFDTSNYSNQGKLNVNSQRQQHQQSPSSSPLSFRKVLLPEMLTRAQSATTLPSVQSSILSGSFRFVSPSPLSTSVSNLLNFFLLLSF